MNCEVYECTGQWSNLRHHTRICLEGLVKTRKTLDKIVAVRIDHFPTMSNGRSLCIYIFFMMYLDMARHKFWNNERKPRLKSEISSSKQVGHKSEFILCVARRVMLYWHSWRHQVDFEYGHRVYYGLKFKLYAYISVAWMYRFFHVPKYWANYNVVKVYD